MQSYQAENIRNIAIVGHGSEGKTTLAEQMLYLSGTIDRLGRVEDGNTTMDYDPEEAKRGVSISAGVAALEWKGMKFNLIDVPGYFDFVGEMCGPMRVAKTAMIVLDGVSGLQVGTEKAWDMATLNGLNKCFVINQMDREHANYSKVLAQLRAKYGTGVVPIMLPWGEGADFKGVVNIQEEKLYEGAGKDPVQKDMPADMADMIAVAKEEAMEAAAMADDELMEKYFEEGALSVEETRAGLRKGFLEGTVIPVVACSATTGVGVARVMEFIKRYLPSPKERVAVGVDPKTNEGITRNCEDSEPFSALVFKTIADPFVGKLSLFRIMSGTLTPQTSIYNATLGKAEKPGTIYILRGKKQIPVDCLHAGDIGAMAKLQYTGTGHTLCDPANPIVLPPIEFPKPCISMAVSAQKSGEEDKVFSGLNRLMEEDPTIRIEKNVETGEALLSGMGELHIRIIRRKLETKFGVLVELSDPKIPYRETIRKKVKAQGRHKKQSGGHGQFGDVWVEFEPIGDTDIEFEFVDKVVGGAVPRNFIPSVEKGLRDNIKRGVLAGYPMVGLRATLYDGSYHPVDSSEMAFKTAARLAYKKGCSEASPVLLEPVNRLEILVPDEFMGDVIGDINTRRGRIVGMNQVEGMQQVIAEVPQAEIFKYATDLRSMTQARGSFTTTFERYEEVPAGIAQKVIDAAKANMVEEEE